MTPNPTTKGMSEAEVLAVWDRLYDWLPDLDHPDNSELQVHRDARVARSTIESTFAELADLKADRDSWRDQCSDRVADWGREHDARIAAESDRTALLEVVRRLLPYARDEGANYEDDGSNEPLEAARDAQALLSRIIESSHPALDACDWSAGARFSVRDEPGEHAPCWLVMPDGGMLSLHHHATNGVDQARAQFIADACNAVLGRVSRPDETLTQSEQNSNARELLARGAHLLKVAATFGELGDSVRDEISQWLADASDRPLLSRITAPEASR